MEKVITLKRFEDEIELKRRQLVSLRMDASSVEAVRQLKGRNLQMWAYMFKTYLEAGSHAVERYEMSVYGYI